VELVGRGSELAGVDRFLELLADSPGAVVVEGDPGIGKTALWRAAIDATRSRSYRVLVCQLAEALDFPRQQGRGITPRAGGGRTRGAVGRSCGARGRPRPPSVGRGRAAPRPHDRTRSRARGFAHRPSAFSGEPGIRPRSCPLDPGPDRRGAATIRGVVRAVREIGASLMQQRRAGARPYPCRAAERRGARRDLAIASRRRCRRRLHPGCRRCLRRRRKGRARR
jgi:hypothetical protein